MFLDESGAKCVTFIIKLPCCGPFKFDLLCCLLLVRLMICLLASVEIANSLHLNCEQVTRGTHSQNLYVYQTGSNRLAIDILSALH